jgi:hypothetical protein
LIGRMEFELHQLSALVIGSSLIIVSTILDLRELSL